MPVLSDLGLSELHNRSRVHRYQTPCPPRTCCLLGMVIQHALVLTVSVTTLPIKSYMRGLTGSSILQFFGHYNQIRGVYLPCLFFCFSIRRPVNVKRARPAALRRSRALFQEEQQGKGSICEEVLGCYPAVSFSSYEWLMSPRMMPA